MSSFIPARTRQPISALCVIVGALTGARPLFAQETIPWPPANLLTVRVSAITEPIAGDTFRVTYTLYNSPSSQQKAELFFVRTDAKPLGWIATPGMRMGWLRPHVGQVADSLGVTWFAAGHRADVIPGDSAAPFAYTAVGEITVVRYYVQGWIEPPVSDDSSTIVGLRPSFWEDNYKGWTIGVMPAADLKPASMAARLVVATITACQEDVRFVRDPAICRDPNSRPRLAMQAAHDGKVPLACAHLRGLITDIEAMADTSIKPEGRALLTTRTQQFLRRHCG